MSEAGLSATEAALENQRIGPLQIRVAALCTLIQICDGYDINSVAWAVPSLTHVWNVPGPAFTTAFLWSSIGILVGALSAGPIGDRVGRKPLLLASVTIFGVASLLSALAPSIPVLSILRFFTGLGIGGAFPGAATLTGDYAPQRLRATMIMASFTGAPIGGFVGGQIVALLLPRFGWPVIFILGGVFPLALVLVLAFWLPESPRFLAGKATLSRRQSALLERLDITAAHRERHPVDIARENPVKMLFGRGYALQTILLWVIFFCSLMNLFLFGYWLPEVLHLIGMTPAQAVFASSLRDLGAIFAVLYLGLLIDRRGPERSLAFHYALGAVFIGLVSLVAMPYGLLLTVIFFCGMTIIGSQTGANATCGKLYPARMRTSGLGWALGVGRLGGIAAPVLGGYLLSLGVAPTQIFLSACLFAVIAAAATGLLALRGTRSAAIRSELAAN
ncbi:MAG: MFS transporter [Alphaproteobacteria bacterium]|nr:MFS transporter [Alphaproteobacteria bacterium]